MSDRTYQEQYTIFQGSMIPITTILSKIWTDGGEPYIDVLEEYAYREADVFLNTCVMHARRALGILPTARRADNSDSSTEHAKEIRKKYHALTDDKQIELMRRCMMELVKIRDNQGICLFNGKQDWIAVHIFYKHRLFQHFTQKEFPAHAKLITPEDLSEKKRIGINTIYNTAHLNLPDGPYYEWTPKQIHGSNKHIPHVHAICTQLWILVQRFIYEIS